jgi:hypothetical protein
MSVCPKGLRTVSKDYKIYIGASHKETLIQVEVSLRRSFLWSLPTALLRHFDFLPTSLTPHLPTEGLQQHANFPPPPHSRPLLLFHLHLPWFPPLSPPLPPIPPSVSSVVQLRQKCHSQRHVRIRPPSQSPAIIRRTNGIHIICVPDGVFRDLSICILVSGVGGGVGCGYVDVRADGWDRWVGLYESWVALDGSVEERNGVVVGVMGTDGWKSRESVWKKA